MYFLQNSNNLLLALKTWFGIEALGSKTKWRCVRLHDQVGKCWVCFTTKWRSVLCAPLPSGEVIGSMTKWRSVRPAPRPSGEVLYGGNVSFSGFKRGTNFSSRKKCENIHVELNSDWCWAELWLMLSWTVIEFLAHMHQLFSKCDCFMLLETAK